MFKKAKKVDHSIDRPASSPANCPAGSLDHHTSSQAARKRFEVVKWSDGSKTRVIRLWGITVSFGHYGNCILKHVNFTNNPVGFFSMRLKWNSHNETTMNFLYTGFNWNCEWVAERWGEYFESEYGVGHPSYHQYQGFLGNHISI